MELSRSAHEIEDCQRRSCGRVHEQELPACVRDVLEAARASRPEHDVICISFHTRENGPEFAGRGPDPELIAGAGTNTVWSPLHPKSLLVLSVAVTETTFESVQTVTHVLVARTRLHGRGKSAGSLR
jgi:hypothetical protein